MKYNLILVIFLLSVFFITGCKTKNSSTIIKRNVRSTPVSQKYATAIDAVADGSYISFFEYMTITYGTDGIYKDIRIIQAENSYVLIYQDAIKGDSFFVPLKEEDYIDFKNKIEDIYNYKSISERNYISGSASGIESFCIRCCCKEFNDSIVIADKFSLADDDYRLKLADLFEEYSRFVNLDY